MKTRGLVLAAVATVVFSSADSFAFGGEDRVFRKENAVSDSELSKMRGGFITAGGMNIEFGLTSETIIDGAVRNQFTISSDMVQKIDNSQLVSIIENGVGNNQLPKIADVPGLVTVIRNTVDGSTIQHYNMLDIVVSNTADFKNDKILPLMDFASALNH